MGLNPNKQNKNVFSHNFFVNVSGEHEDEDDDFDEQKECKYSQMSLVARKPVFGVSDQIQHKLGCSASKDG